jgi:hypothetical protein
MPGETLASEHSFDQRRSQKGVASTRRAQIHDEPSRADSICTVKDPLHERTY